MENEQLEFTLPPAPRGLCFDRNDFVKTNFSVDNFLSQHQKSLEAMRDDLGIYLKVLRLAMIELINKDYANFVNLSATLIGFDKAIEKIQLPLGQLNEEVLSVKQCLEEAMKELSMWLNQRNVLSKKKQLLRFYSQTLKSLAILKSILSVLDDKDGREKIALVDRGAMQYNQLKFAMNKCETLVKFEHKQEFAEIGVKLIRTLNDLVFHYWNENDEDNLLRTLIILASLNRVSETEELIRKRAIAPHVVEIINESSLQKSKDGLNDIYRKVLSLLDGKLNLLLTVMHHTKLAFLVKKYRFLVNCFWREVETGLEVNLSSIFAPGNPRIFYSRYNDSMDFIRRLEAYCPDKDTVKLLRNTTEYTSFQKRWNLPVYFQIRFQEIAGAFESNLQKSPTYDNTDIFLLKETKSCWKALQECWSDGVYIDALAHKFWKLSMQLLSRYTTWVNAFCLQKSVKFDSTSVNKDLIINSINIYIDVQTLTQRLPEFLQMVESKINIEKKTLRDSLKHSEEMLLGTHAKIRECIVGELFDYFNMQLKQVSDIPRLYRKTNRSVPSKPCTYIDTITTTALQFSDSTFLRLDNSYVVHLFGALFNLLTNSYYKYVDDVLTSVQKTEESLRRLKQIRDRAPQQASEMTGLTDGDKIRLQVNVDVVAYGRLAESLKLNVNNIEKFNELRSMVTEAVRNIEIK